MSRRMNVSAFMNAAVAFSASLHDFVIAVEKLIVPFTHGIRESRHGNRAFFVVCTFSSLVIRNCRLVMFRELANRKVKP